MKKRAEKDAKEDAECTEDEFRQLALYAEYGRVLTIGIIMEKDGAIIHRGVLGRNRSDLRFHCDELKILRGFWKLLKDFKVDRDLIIGHNVFWDLKFLRKRSLINRIRPSVDFPFTRFRSRPIYDTMQEWCSWDYQQSISLVDLAEVLKVGFGKTENMDGSRVYEQYCAGCHELIAEYCLRDVELARAVYYRMVNPEGPESSGETVDLPGTKKIAL